MLGHVRTLRGLRRRPRVRAVLETHLGRGGRPTVARATPVPVRRFLSLCGQRASIARSRLYRLDCLFGGGIPIPDAQHLQGSQVFEAIAARACSSSVGVPCGSNPHSGGIAWGSRSPPLAPAAPASALLRPTVLLRGSQGSGPRGRRGSTCRAAGPIPECANILARGGVKVEARRRAHNPRRCWNQDDELLLLAIIHVREHLRGRDRHLKDRRVV